MKSVIYVKNLVGRWPLCPVLQQPALQPPATSKYRVKITFWVLEDGARRPSSYYGLPCLNRLSCCSVSILMLGAGGRGT